MIECLNISEKVIRNHYDVSTLFYRMLWGPHIHHGLWDADETPRVAQLQLTERLASNAEIFSGARVLDAGCGMGGSSRWMAKQFACEVTGVTISPVQRHWAALTATLQRCRPRPRFLCENLERCHFDPGTFDFVWSVECTEHLFEKAQFFQNAARWLKPQGRFAICAWLVGRNETDPDTIRQVQGVCEGMFCPSLGTQGDYENWFQAAGMRIVKSELWTEKVAQTWEICKRRVDRSGVRCLARVLGQNHTLFLSRFDAILNAYRSGAMEYGCFIAERT